MQIEFLKQFIDAYENAYKKEFDESFEGKVKKLCKEFDEPFMHLSLGLKERLKSLIFSLEKNIQIAIIGQFSSGKSSLLNLILGREYLPTGVVPVTFKPTFLHYGKDYILRVEFEDGSDVIAGLSELEFYTDQRKSLKEAKSIHIYAPVPLLKHLSLVDTPGLNANESDTLTTFRELENIHCVIWLSLIDNAGKKSEEDAIKANLKLLGKNSLCVLNQKDKLNQVELERVLEYAGSVFGKYFKQIIAISCKEAKEKDKYDKSNFNALLKYLENIDTKNLKREFSKRKLLEFCQITKEENILFDTIFNELELKFEAYENYLRAYFADLREKIKLLNHQILEQLKSIAERLSIEIFSFVREKEAFFYKETQGFFKKNLYHKYSYKTPFISSDDAFLAMFYHSDVMNREFKRIKKKFEISFEDLKWHLKESFETLKKEILLFKARISNIQKDDFLQSEKNFADLRAFASASEEYFLRDFENILFKNNLDLELFFEKLNLKAFANYENACKLSLSFFSRKINESRTFYELDSSQFSLYYPKKSEIYERVLNELNVYEFENLLIVKPVILKVIGIFFEQNLDLIVQKRALILTKKEENNKRLNYILALEERIKAL